MEGEKEKKPKKQKTGIIYFKVKRQINLQSTQNVGENQNEYHIVTYSFLFCLVALLAIWEITSSFT